MGPLVPDIIGNELNFVVAFFVGIAFGFVLEQAGFSTSKKLVGLFYGYDFTVLRVFFTAGVTAMFGVIILTHFGLLDMSLVYVNPTFLWSAIIGGLIMGLGFVVGGFCPGTSICAAAIGKIDAMIFLAGSFLGVLIFAEGYPLFEGLYKAAPWGNVRIFETLGMSQSLFAFLLTFVAVGAFWAVTFIETKVNGKPNPEFKPVRLYIAVTAIAVLIGLSTFFLPDRREAMLKDVADAQFIGAHPVKTISVDELAFRLLDDDQSLQIFDLRSKKDFDGLSLPHSTLVTMQNIFEKDAGKLLSIKHKRNVFLANDEAPAREAAVLAKELGYSDLFVLEGGLNRFRKEILGFEIPQQDTRRQDTDTERFRAKASQAIPILIRENKQKLAGSSGKQKSKRVVGGC